MNPREGTFKSNGNSTGSDTENNMSNNQNASFDIFGSQQGYSSNFLSSNNNNYMHQQQFNSPHHLQQQNFFSLSNQQSTPECNTISSNASTKLTLPLPSNRTIPTTINNVVDTNYYEPNTL